MTAPVRVGRVGGIRWNPTLARYIDANGRIVSTATVRRELDLSIDAMKIDVRALAAELRAGRISLSTWEREMRVIVKDVHILSVAGARGGWAQLGQAEFGRIGALVRDQYDYLYQFARDIQSGKQSLTGVENRALMYVDAGRRSFGKQQLVTERDVGYDIERSIRHASDSCDDCIGEELKRWQPIGTLIPIGERECLSRCKCTIERAISDAARARARRRRRR